MQRYSIGGRTVTTAAAADNGIAVLWNASTTKSIFVRSISLLTTAAVTATLASAIARISVRGTATTTLTPDIDSHFGHAVAPPSGALIDLSWSVQPTVLAPYLARFKPHESGGNIHGINYNWNGLIQVPQSTGLAIVTTIAVVFIASDIWVVWDE
jgi:hypothetical protein